MAALTPRARIFAGIALSSFLLDQWSKYWAVSALTNGLEGGAGFFERLGLYWSNIHPRPVRAIEVVDGFWRYRYAENPGAAWSFLADAPSWFRVPFFMIFACVALVMILVFFKKSEPGQKIFRVALAFIFSGALGNVFDRVHLGYVIDFIQWHYVDKFVWPTFNVADVSIAVGMGLMILDMIVYKDPNKASSKKEKQKSDVSQDEGIEAA